MQWEILVAVIMAIGICAAVLEARAKRIAGKNRAIFYILGLYLLLKLFELTAVGEPGLVADALLVVWLAHRFLPIDSHEDALEVKVS